MATVNQGSRWFLMAEQLPELAEEIRTLLNNRMFEGDSTFTPEELEALSQSVDGLRILSRCRCGDDFCASFSTGDQPEADYGRQRTLIADGVEGILNLDVLNGRIIEVDVLYRPEVKAKLDALFP